MCIYIYIYILYNKIHTILIHCRAAGSHDFKL